MSFHGTTVTFFRRSDGAYVGYRTEGHTGYARAGVDIVCAAVSALTQSTLNGLENVLCAPVRARISDRPALLEVEFKPDVTPSQLSQAQLLLVTLLEGLRAIERGYPRNVRIIIEERRESICS